MATREYPRAQGGSASLDICWSCRALWFDTHESAQLAPAGIIGLFREIHENTRDSHPLGEALRCPRCTGSLALRQDLVRTGRISYYRCLDGHGRFTPFTQFLIEKGFIRALRPAELATLKARIAEVRCSGCGAPVDLVRDTACGHCRSPIAVLDADAVDKALAAYSEAAARVPPRRHDVVGGLLQQIERDRQRRGESERRDEADLVDLIAVGLSTVVAPFL
jgi:hypothetical protein